MDFKHAFYLELIKTSLSLLVLGVTWLLGQQILAYWEVQKKQKELDIGTATQFQQLYGEFKTVWRLWKIYYFNDLNNNKDITLKTFPPPEHLRWELLKRATAAEGSVESILVKMATERDLSANQLEYLGLFRQAYQQLREAIRDNKPINWKREDAEYKLLNDLASETATIIFSSKHLKYSELSKGQMQLKTITDYTLNNWEIKTMEIDKVKAGNRMSEPRNK
jgi:hypothetical protein